MSYSIQYKIIIYLVFKITFENGPSPLESPGALFNHDSAPPIYVPTKRLAHY